jgi:hypothetical protein
MDLDKHPPAETSGPRRVTDSDRADTAGELAQAVGHGQLTLAEYIDRLDLVYQATSRPELAVLTGDLARPVGSLPVTVTDSLALFADVVRAGTWQVPAHSSAVAVFGDVELDLRQATTTEKEVHITATAIFGDVWITVPEGIEAILESDAVLSHAHSCTLAPVPRKPGTPLIRVQPLGWFGNVHIESRTPAQPRLSTAWREHRQRRRARRS